MRAWTQSEVLWPIVTPVSKIKYTSYWAKAVYIPVRLPFNAFDLTRPAREVTPPVRQVERKDVLADVRSAPQFPPGLRDVGDELDRLLTRLAGDQGRRSRADVELERGKLQRASSIASTGDMNPANTSFEKVYMTFAGGSSTAKIGGTFVGGGQTAGAKSLNIVIDADATLGADPSALAFHLTDHTGATLFSYSGNARAGQTISTGGDIGLDITFAEGTLAAGQSSGMQVFQLVPTEIDPRATFGNADPNLRPRFESGREVTAGSFTLNGKTITVSADDSIASVLQRIEEQVPELSASFKDDKLTIESRSYSRKPIEIGNDTSGFLAATKLEGATPKQGFVRPEDELLVESERFANVRAGSFQLGGKSISVDPLTDTLGSVLAQMNDAAPGAVRYDEESKRMVLRAGDDTVLGEDSTGFLSALGLDGAGELGEREGMQLDPGVAARLQRGLDGWQAELVDQTISALSDSWNESAEAEAARAAEARSAATRAKAAYGRDAGPARDDAPVFTPAPSARFERAFAASGLGAGLGGAPPRGLPGLSPGGSSATQRGGDGADARAPG